MGKRVVLVCMLLLLLAMGRRMPKLDEQTVVLFTPNGGTCEWSAWIDPGDGAKQIKIGEDFGELVPGDCISHSYLDATVLSCCSEVCIAGEPDPAPMKCDRIFDYLTGRMYHPREVNNWHEAQSGN